ncbi:hypothetical protein BDM02DRAFT_3187683 [Thelephora ganbajun]|uniref:Uncharacterized protein n=1 Tax=Thelephora ganbajun TaxID=370292 RepID=A0ACB6ZDB0_THEGA|nr:hypothetical protein BDM02DRAFT_3187683 [Thelephora ganbajun]
MDHPRRHLQSTSSSSAIDLTGTPAGLVVPLPPLSPNDGPESVTRRRPSWSAPRVSSPQPTVQTIIQAFSVGDDPVVPPDEDTPPRSRAGSAYLTTQAGPSFASLIPAFPEDEDNEARLTVNTSHRHQPGWSIHDNKDPERSIGASPKSRRRSSCYSTSPSSLKKTGTTIQSVSRSLRHMSIRVVNLAGRGLDDHVRLGDEDGGSSPKRKGDYDYEEPEYPALPDLRKSLPTRGRTLGFMGPTNPIRLLMYRFLLFPWTEPVILLLISLHLVVLSIQSAHSLTLANPDAKPLQVRGYFHQWEDYALFALFIFFTTECFARICVSGLVLDPEVPFSIFTSQFKPSEDEPIPGAVTPGLTRTPPINRPGVARIHTLGHRLRQMRNNFFKPFALHHKPIVDTMNLATAETARTRSETETRTSMIEKAIQRAHDIIRDPKSQFLTNFLRSDKPDTVSLPFKLTIEQSHQSTRRNMPYLRQSWNRIDFLSILCFWISFALATEGIEKGSTHIGIFRALSVLKVSRLLAVTSGTTTIMSSLKTARPLLTNMTYFVLFAMLLFSIIGIESFKGSFGRSCFLQPTLGEAEIQISGVACGGWINSQTLETMPYIKKDGTEGIIKGYICPVGQEGDNPFNNIESYDNFFYAVLQVVIISTQSGFTSPLYSSVDSEYFLSCFFYIICVIVLNFWLISLFLAVITNSFSAIRKETRKSAFGAAPLIINIDGEHDENFGVIDGRSIATRRGKLKDYYQMTKWFWVILALASLTIQATRTVNSGPIHRQLLNTGELVITITFDIEIIVRFATYLPYWRGFFRKGRNWIDLILVIGSTIIQIPLVRSSSAYPWLTVFQLLRFYRVILEVPRMKPLLLAVFGDMYGMANMILFLFLFNFIAALMAVQLLRGSMRSDQATNFGDVYNAFLGMWQIFTSDNWTVVLYNAALASQPVQQSIVVILFITGWMLFANFVMMQMFIAVINENFEVAEEAKKGKQASHYWASQRQEKTQTSWTRKLNPYRWFAPAPKAIAVDNLPSNLVLPMQKALVQDHSVPKRRPSAKVSAGGERGPWHYLSYPLKLLQNFFVGEQTTAEIPLTDLKNLRRDNTVPSDPNYDEMENHLEVLATLNAEDQVFQDVSDALYERRAQKADFIRNHPSYDKTFWVFSQKNIVRQWCQKVVEPACGERIFGQPHSRLVHPIFQLLILCAIIAGIVVESIATPVYRRNYYTRMGLIRGSWFDIAEASLGLVLILEFLIKITADGLSFTPNAYLRSPWNVFDLFVLVGLTINIVTGLVFVGGLSRLTRSLKALRVLRLITLVGKMRATFQSLIVSGALRIFDAAVLAVLYIIPFAVWGLNIFAGRMNICNDTTVGGLSDCVGEFPNSAIGSSPAFPFPVPRVWSNPSPSTTFSFDSFRASLLILFEIISFQGWSDVMGAATSITQLDQQPQTSAAEFNSLFFISYILLGGIIIFTIFVSIIIDNFSVRTGTAFLTQPQREWVDLKRLISRQRPSKRPKRGWWSRVMTLLYVLHILVLMTQSYAISGVIDDIRSDFFLVISGVVILDAAIRGYGLGWHSFCANGWNIFDTIVGLGSFITTLVVRFWFKEGVFTLQKLFIVAIAFKLVQRADSLNKLFKTAISSLPDILSLMALWLILFMFFAVVFVEALGLTKWGSAESHDKNHATIAHSLVMLAVMSCGESWNQYMHDYTLAYPRCTNLGSETDCGSPGWALCLFITWNILSMFIFANMFTGVVVENFSYVFQLTSGTKSITRDEMRAFKTAWVKFANTKTQRLEKNRFVPFFAELSGIFEVRIYPLRYNLPNLKATVTASELDWNSSHVVQGIDLTKLKSTLDGIDYTAVKEQKALYSRLYHEANVMHHSGKGISFTEMLLLLAHYKLIVDRDALVLKDLVVRTETNKLVTDLVNLDRVKSLLKMIIYRRRFKDHLRRIHAQEIPSIVVENPPATPLSTMLDIGGSPLLVYGETEIPSPSNRDSRVSDLGSIRPRSGSLRRRSRGEISSIELSPSHRDTLSIGGVSVHTDVDDILLSMQNSVWGDMFVEAAEDEKL